MDRMFALMWMRHVEIAAVPHTPRRQSHKTNSKFAIVRNMKKNSKKNQYEEGTERDVPNRSQATRKKRRDSKVEFENSNVTSAILLACKALTIVLQHGMVPRLGWDMNILEQRLPRLRDAIMNHRVKLSDVRD